LRLRPFYEIFPPFSTPVRVISAVSKEAADIWEMTIDRPRSPNYRMDICYDVM
jgi:hypothetical protein